MIRVRGTPSQQYQCQVCLKLVVSPAAQVSGGQIPPAAKKDKHCCSLATSAHHFPPSNRPQLTRLLASPDKGDPSLDARLKRTSRFNLLRATSSKKRHKHIHGFSCGTKTHHLYTPSSNKENKNRHNTSQLNVSPTLAACPSSNKKSFSLVEVHHPLYSHVILLQ